MEKFQKPKTEQEMIEFPRHPNPPPYKNQNPPELQHLVPQKRLCDYCGDSMALLYCGADSAKLCISCDREVHSTNQLFSKHTRLQLCDACDSSPASILCETEHSVLCQNCDWERHGLSLSSTHNRRPLEGFIGCPPVSELLAIVGFEDLGYKDLFLRDESSPDGSGLDGFSDLLVWDAPAIVSLDDLIGATDTDHNFRAMKVPSLPKNRNAACGRHKDEMIRQLRELAKLEPNLNYANVDAKPLIGFQSLVPEQNLKPENMFTGCEHDAEPNVFPAYEASAFQWCSDSGELANQDLLPSSLLRSYFEESSTVPDKHSDIGGNLSHPNDGHDGKSQNLINTESCSTLGKFDGSLSVFPKVAPHELTSQDRESAISRYKEKKKTRRYDRHIRYESRKVRAESRTRIRGRFAKVDH